MKKNAPPQYIWHFCIKKAVFYVTMNIKNRLLRNCPPSNPPKRGKKR
ncbi:MAG: hypothetical protein RL757_1630 [Bacteroidota bacterium]|jgi:hypothetical protein